MAEGDGSDESVDLSTANTIRERSDRSGFVFRLLMGLNRFALAGALALLVFGSFVAISVLVKPSPSVDLATSTAVQYLFSSMIGVVVTGTTLVVTISQLVISQENGPLGDQRKRMSDAMDARAYVSELLGTTTPADPSTFLQALVDAVERRAEALDRTVHRSDNGELRRQVDEFVNSVHGNSQAVSDALEGQQFGTFGVVRAALDFNYSWKIFQVERMMEEFGDDLTEGQTEAFEDLRTSLTMFGPAREHIKTLYFQWALIDLSRYILYVAVPALIVAGATLTFVGPQTFTGVTLFVPNITWVLGAAFSITSLPFLLFVAYILRIVTVAKRTLAIGPLILRSSQR